VSCWKCNWYDLTMSMHHTAVLTTCRRHMVIMYSSFGWCPSVRILRANVSEHSVCYIFIGCIHTIYEDGIVRVIRNIGTQNSDARASLKRKNTTFTTRQKFEIKMVIGYWCQKMNIKKNVLKVKIKYQCHFNPLYLRYPNKYYVMKNATAHE